MPKGRAIRSKAQLKYLMINNPKVGHKLAHETSKKNMKNLPKYARKKK